MGEVALAHQIVRLKRLLDVVVVDSHGHTHQHVLGALGHFAVQAKQVRALKGLEAKIVVVVVTAVIDVVVEHLGVGHDDIVHFLGNEGGVLVGLGVDVLAQIGDDVGEHILCRAVEIVHADSSRQSAVVRVMGRQRGGGFGSELVEFSRGDTVVKPLDGQLRHVARVHPRWVQPFRKRRQFLVDGIETDIFPFPFSVHNLHGHGSFLLVFI